MEVSEARKIHMDMADCLEQMIQELWCVLIQSKPKTIAALPILVEVCGAGPVLRAVADSSGHMMLAIWVCSDPVKVKDQCCSN